VLQNTFVHCPAVGPATERRLWRNGLLTWDNCLAEGAPVPRRLEGWLLPRLAESRERLAAGDFRWFAAELPRSEHWRALSEFGDRIGYLDIETTGSSAEDSTTVVGIYDGQTMHQFVRNENLRDFADLLESFTAIVTFAGSSFDLPVLTREFGVRFPQLHVDLCHVLRRIGLKGGLKSIETQLGLRRSDETTGMSGYDAVRLWWQWWNDDDEVARRNLLAYNAEDVANMQTILQMTLPRVLRAAWGDLADQVLGS
jgi:uncharacterized protein YprB with RNaseH-like and TPR domain